MLPQFKVNRFNIGTQLELPLSNRFETGLFVTHYTLIKQERAEK